MAAAAAAESTAAFGSDMMEAIAKALARTERGFSIRSKFKTKTAYLLTAGTDDSYRISTTRSGTLLLRILSLLRLQDLPESLRHRRISVDLTADWLVLWTSVRPRRTEGTSWEFS